MQLWFYRKAYKIGAKYVYRKIQVSQVASGLGVNDEKGDQKTWAKFIAYFAKRVFGLHNYSYYSIT